MTYSPNLDSGPDLTYQDLHEEFFQVCTWHKLVKQVKKKIIKRCRWDTSPCHEEGTEIVERIEADYDVCPMHKRMYESLRGN